MEQLSHSLRVRRSGAIWGLRFSTRNAVTVHLNIRRLLEGESAVEGSRLALPCLDRQDRNLRDEVCDKGKPGESRRRKAPRLKRATARHASRAADSHY